MKSGAENGCGRRVTAAGWMMRLREKAGRVTQPRRLILEALLGLQRPSTPKEIAAQLPEGQGDLVTVYRSMALFEEMGVVRRVDFGDGLARFEIADDDPDGHHHHHLVCRVCGGILKLEDCILADLEKRLARQHGFQHITHRLEFFGICPECSSGNRRPARRKSVKEA